MVRMSFTDVLPLAFVYCYYCKAKMVFGIDHDLVNFLTQKSPLGDLTLCAVLQA